MDEFARESAEIANAIQEVARGHDLQKVYYGIALYLGGSFAEVGGADVDALLQELRPVVEEALQQTKSGRLQTKQ